MSTLMQLVPGVESLVSRGREEGAGYWLKYSKTPRSGRWDVLDNDNVPFPMVDVYHYELVSFGDPIDGVYYDKCSDDQSWTVPRQQMFFQLS